MLTSYNNKKRLNNSGAAIVLVLCIMAVFLVLSLAVMLSAAVLSNSVNSSRALEQSRIAAVSMSKVLQQQMTEAEESGGIRDYLNSELAGGNVLPDSLDIDLSGLSDLNVDKITIELDWDGTNILQITTIAARGDQSYRVKVRYSCTQSGGVREWRLSS